MSDRDPDAREHYLPAAVAGEAPSKTLRPMKLAAEMLLLDQRADDGYRAAAVTWYMPLNDRGTDAMRTALARRPSRVPEDAAVEVARRAVGLIVDECDCGPSVEVDPDSEPCVAEWTATYRWRVKPRTAEQVKADEQAHRDWINSVLTSMSTALDLAVTRRDGHSIR